MKLAKKLKKLRSKNNLTIKEVSTRLKVTMKKVSKWENGLSIPNTKELHLLSEIYNVKSSSLFSTKFDIDATIKEGVEFFDKSINKRKFILNVIAIFLIVISIASTLISAIYMWMLSTPKDSPYYFATNNIETMVFYQFELYALSLFIVAIIILLINFLIDLIKKKRIEKLRKKVGGIYDN